MKEWTKTDEKLVYDGYRKILRRTFELPNGQAGDFDVIKSNSGAGILALTPDNKVVCFRQFRPGPEAIMFELPGGTVDDNEQPEVAAARELLEETGYSADVEYIGSYWRDAYVTNRWHMCVGRNAVLTGNQKLELGEYGEVVLLSLDEFKEVLFAGDLTDTTIGYAGLRHLGLL